MISQVMFLFVLIQLIAVSYGDIKYKKIPNVYTLLNIVVFIILLFAYPKIYIFSWDTFIYPIAFLVVGFVLFLINIMGAGDVKYLFSFFLITPVENQDVVFYYLLLSTVSIGVLLLLINTVRNFEKLMNAIKIGNVVEIKSIYGSKFSFAPVILFAWVAFGWKVKNILFNL